MNRPAAACLGMLLAIAFGSSGAAAGELRLKGGGRVSGAIVERTATTITVETAPGRVTLALSRVEKVDDEPSALEVWLDRAARLSPGDLEGWAALARWAADRQLMTQARESWQRVVLLDPAHAEANTALDRVLLDGAWVSREEAYRARGYQLFEGRFVLPAERDAIEQERRAEAEEALLRREAEVRAREAEARAREAEALARQADAGGEGIPLWWGGSSYLPFGGPRHGRRQASRGEHRQHGRAPAPTPASSTPPSSIGAPHASAAAGAASGHGSLSSR